MGRPDCCVLQCPVAAGDLNSRLQWHRMIGVNRCSARSLALALGRKPGKERCGQSGGLLYERLAKYYDKEHLYSVCDAPIGHRSVDVASHFGRNENDARKASRCYLIADNRLRVRGRSARSPERSGPPMHTKGDEDGNARDNPCITRKRNDPRPPRPPADSL